MKLIYKTLIITAVFAAGVAAGHFHGKSVVYEALFAKSDYMTINPVTIERIK